jgi:signal peptidase II
VAPRPTASRSGGPLLFVLVAGAAIIADRITKIWVERALPLNGERTELLPDWLWLTHVRNRGAAFGLLPQFTPLLLAFSLAVAAVLIYYYRRTPADRLEIRVALALIFGGALANAYDRALDPRGVVDFIGVPHWPVFNLADSAVSVGVTILVVSAMLDRSRRRAR